MHRPLLIVDDDSELREALAELFRMEGFQVVEAGDGQEALHYLQDRPLPCAVILDLMMPVMDGWTLRRRMLERPDLADVPVLISSALAAEQRHRNDLQAQAYFPKPFHLAGLLEAVREYCPAE